MRAPRKIGLALGLAAVLGSAPALAGDPKEAQALFDRGLDAMEAKRYDDACPALDASYKIDPLPGALFMLAECERMRGHLSAAARRYDEYLTMYPTLAPARKAKQGDREKKAREHRNALAGKLAELTLVLPPGAPKGTEVTRDGVPIPEAMLGAPDLVDPGEHVIVAKAPDGTSTEMRVKLSAGEKRGFSIEVRTAASAPTKAPVEEPVVLSAAPATRKPSVAVIATGGALAGTGIVVGAVLLGVSASKGGTITSLAAEVKAKGACPKDPAKATGDCATLDAAIRSKATLGNAGLWMLVGGGVVGVATLLYGVVGGEKAPPKTSLRVLPIVTAEGAGLVVGAKF